VLTSDSYLLLRELAEKSHIPVTTTIQGLGAFDEWSDLSLHMLGMHGSAYANYAMQNADLIIAIGARFDDRCTGKIADFARMAKRADKEGRGGIIHFDISPRNIGKVVTPTVPVLGDCKEALTQLLPLVQHKTVESEDRKEWFGIINSWKSKYPFNRYHKAKEGEKLKPQTVIEELNRQCEAIGKDKVLITTGVGQHQMWAAQYYRWRHPRTMITSGGLGTMGYGLPAAIGAKLGAPEKIVIDIDGDGSLCMTMMELATAVQFKIGVKVLLLNNDFQGMVKQWQELFYECRYSATQMVNPDFVAMCHAFGMKGIRVSSEKELPKAMAEFLAYPGPVLMEAVVTNREHVLPMVAVGKALDDMVLSEEQEYVVDKGVLPPS
jgi:acetolactate synthase-1/2/3 large subunit